MKYSTATGTYRFAMASRPDQVAGGRNHTGGINWHLQVRVDLHYSAQPLRSTIHSLWKTGCPPIFLSVLEQAVSLPTLLPQSQPA